MAPWKQWLVAPQAARSCVTVGGMAQWLCVFDGRLQRKVLSWGALCHTGSVNVCCPGRRQRHVRSRDILELRHPIPNDELGTKAACQLLERKLGECCLPL